MLEETAPIVLTQKPNNNNNFPTSKNVVVSSEFELRKQQQQQQQQTADKLFVVGILPMELCQHFAERYSAEHIDLVIQKSSAANSSRAGWIRRALEKGWAFPPPPKPVVPQKTLQPRCGTTPIGRLEQQREAIPAAERWRRDIEAKKARAQQWYGKSLSR